MKVLLIDVNCKTGSTGKIVYDLHTQLMKDGYSSAVCYGRGPLINEPNILKFSGNAEMYFHALLTRITGLTGYYSFFATRDLIRFMNEYKPDVVHLHELHAYFVNPVSVINYLKKNRIKTIWTFHCEFMYTGKCGHSYECEKWKTECGKCPYLKDYPSSLLMDFTKKMHSDKKRVFEDFSDLTIVTPSGWLADRVKQSFLKDKEIVVVPNGIDTKNVFYPRDFSHLKTRHNITNEKVILSVAPDIMSDQKGGRYVLELARKLKKENIKFILIGAADIKEKSEDNVIVLGRTENQQELAEYYSMADLFVICSKKETFSMTCIESLACGTPVIGFKSGGPESIAIEKYSEFVEYKDIDALTKAALRWVNKKSGMTPRLSSIAASRYSREYMYTRYLELYKKYTNIET